MIKITYVGNHDAVHVPALGADVARGETVDVADADLAASLLEQVDNWQPAKPAPSRAKPDTEE